MFTKFGHEPITVGVDLISDVLPFGRLWSAEPSAISNTTGYDHAGNVIETHEHTGDFKES